MRHASPEDDAPEDCWINGHAVQAVLALGLRAYLEGQGDLVTSLIMGIIWVTIWVIGVKTILTKSP